MKIADFKAYAAGKLPGIGDAQLDGIHPRMQIHLVVLRPRIGLYVVQLPGGRLQSAARTTTISGRNPGRAVFLLRETDGGKQAYGDCCEIEPEELHCQASPMIEVSRAVFR